MAAVNEFTPTFPSNPVVPVVENTLSNPLHTYTAEDADYTPHGITSYTIQTGKYVIRVQYE